MAETPVIKTPTLQFLTESIPLFTVGKTQSFTLQATGGTEPYTIGIESGTLPNGLVCNSTGMIYGTPTEKGYTTVFFYLMDVTEGIPTSTKVTQAYNMEVNDPSKT